MRPEDMHDAPYTNPSTEMKGCFFQISYEFQWQRPPHGPFVLFWQKASFQDKADPELI